MMLTGGMSEGLTQQKITLIHGIVVMTLKMCDENCVPVWENIARTKRANRDNAIPPEWRLSCDVPDGRLNVLGVPAECGILTARELTITETDAAALVNKLISREYTSREVWPIDQL
jgi:hypothetical protein